MLVEQDAMKENRRIIDELDEIENSKKNAKIQQVRNDVEAIKKERDAVKSIERQNRVDPGEQRFPFTHGHYIEQRRKRLNEERTKEFLDHNEQIQQEIYAAYNNVVDDDAES